MSSDEGRSWPGLIPLARRFLFGKAESPLADYIGPGMTWTESEQYESMPYGLKHFRRDSLVKKCTLTNAFFSCMTAGFETELQATDPEADIDLEDYAYVKTGVDQVNTDVNMDLALFVAQIKRSIFGKSGFEIVLDDRTELPRWLLSLESDLLKPDIDKDWKLTGFTYKGTPKKYTPEKVLYFVNLQLESDRLGINDVEGIVAECDARHVLLRTDFPKIVEKIWAPYVFAQVDTRGLSEAETKKALKNLAKILKAGRSVVVNEAIQAQVVDITPNIGDLVKLLFELKQAIIGNYGTPRFLVGEPIENRATAYAELESYVAGPIAFIQKYFKRELEASWYKPLTLKLMEGEGVKVPEEELPPVEVKHNWSKIRTADVYEMAKAAAALWDGGMGVVGGKLEKAWEMMGWNYREDFPEEEEEPET